MCRPSLEVTLRLLLGLLILFLIGLQLVVKDEVDAEIVGLVTFLVVLALLDRIVEFQAPGGISLKLVQEAAESRDVLAVIEAYEGVAEEDAQGFDRDLYREARGFPRDAVAEAAQLVRRRIANLDATILNRKYPIGEPGVVADMRRRGIVTPGVSHVCEISLAAADEFLLRDDDDRHKAADLVWALERAFKALRPLAVLEGAARAALEAKGWDVSELPRDHPNRRPDLVASKDGELSLRVKPLYTTRKDSALPASNAKRLAKTTDAPRKLVVLPYRARYEPLPHAWGDEVWIVPLSHLNKGRLPAVSEPVAALDEDPETAA